MAVGGGDKGSRGERKTGGERVRERGDGEEWGPASGLGLTRVGLTRPTGG